VAEADLVDKPVAEQRQALKQNAAPALSGKSEAEALLELAARKKQRAGVQAKIDALRKKRDQALAAAEGAGAKDAFDAQVIAKMKERGAKVGIAY
jgi:hypothetical protein